MVRLPAFASWTLPLLVVVFIFFCGGGAQGFCMGWWRSHRKSAAADAGRNCRKSQSLNSISTPKQQPNSGFKLPFSWLVVRYRRGTAKAILAAISDASVDTMKDGAASLSRFSPTNTVSSFSIALGNVAPLLIEGEDDDDDEVNTGAQSFLDAMRVPTFQCHGGDLFPCCDPPPDRMRDGNNGNDNSTTATMPVVYRSLQHLFPPNQLHSQEQQQYAYDPVFCLNQVLPKSTCDEVIRMCETGIMERGRSAFQSFQAGKNHHGALQLLVSPDMADAVAERLRPYLGTPHIQAMVQARRTELRQQAAAANTVRPARADSIDLKEEADDNDVQLMYAGLNRRWRLYKYAPNSNETFAPHIDAGFPPSGLSSFVASSSSANQTETDQPFRETFNNNRMVYDDSSEFLGKGGGGTHCSAIVSRLTVLFYLTDDFVGGETNFYTPMCTRRPATSRDMCSNSIDSNNHSSFLMASIRPITGSCLIFPQCVGPDSMDYARHCWPLHEGSPVLSGNPKYVIRSDVLFAEYPAACQDPVLTNNNNNLIG